MDETAHHSAFGEVTRVYILQPASLKHPHQHPEATDENKRDGDGHTCDCIWMRGACARSYSSTGALIPS